MKPHRKDQVSQVLLHIRGLVRMPGKGYSCNIHQLDPAGPCQIITKERPIDENLGSYEDVDEAVQKFSQGALEHVTLYSIMQDPMTSCGCFECICVIEPFLTDA